MCIINCSILMDFRLCWRLCGRIQVSKKSSPLFFSFDYHQGWKSAFSHSKMERGGGAEKQMPHHPRFWQIATTGLFTSSFLCPPPPFGCFSVLYALSRAGNCPPQDIFWREKDPLCFDKLKTFKCKRISKFDFFFSFFKFRKVGHRKSGLIRYRHMHLSVYPAHKATTTGGQLLCCTPLPSPLRLYV